jgi:hypothetical protein
LFRKDKGEGGGGQYPCWRRTWWAGRRL